MGPQGLAEAFLGLAWAFLGLAEASLGLAWTSQDLDLAFLSLAKASHTWLGPPWA